IEHSDKMITVYAHLDSIQKNTGDTVKRGEIIALSGATGTVTGPHLHFEIRKNYVTALNPMRIIRR
ncbi:MAG TPA: M23 family metallopeptidase, partial [Spirochaetota bacterium]|nr:M23 family metallopeptidase [Spirochaetota bacterium]